MGTSTRWRPRWATHDAVAEGNAHPCADPTGRFRIVLNGIDQNDLEIHRRLAAESVRRTTHKISSRRALVAMCADQPDTLVGVPRECPLVVRVAAEERFIASPSPAFDVVCRRSPELAEHAEQIFYVPFIDPILQVPLPAVPLHLFAHQLARERALNVDQPRNLAKTGTVE